MHGKPPKTFPCQVISLGLVKVRVVHFGKGGGILFELRFNFIAQSRKRGARARVGDDALPFGVAIQFREDGGQIICQTFALGGRQRFDGSFNFGNRAHLVDNLVLRRRAVK